MIIQALPVNDIKHFLKNLMNHDKVFILQLRIDELRDEEGKYLGC